MSAAALFAAVLLLPAQDPQAACEDLAAENPVTAELARRVLFVATPEEIDVPALGRLLGGPTHAAAAAASVLAHHGLGSELRRKLLARPEAELQVLAIDLATTEELKTRLGHENAELCVAAMHALEDRAELGDAALLESCGDEDAEVAAAALRLLVYERAVLPIDALSDLAPLGRDRLLEALSERPRAACAGWLQSLLANEALEARSRMHAIAALPSEAITLDLAREVVEAMGRPELRGAAQWASMRFPAKVADALVGAMHRSQESGIPIEVLLGSLSNASDLGERQMLALTQLLPASSVERICDWLASRQAPGLVDHIETALDGEAPIPLHLLRRSAPYLDTDERVARIAALLRDGEFDERALSFYALADADVYRPEMLDYAFATEPRLDGGRHSDRARRFEALLASGAPGLPAELPQQLLGDPDEMVRMAAIRHLGGGELTGDAGESVLDLVADDALGRAAARAISLRGSASLVERMWEGAAPELRRRILVWLVEQPRPWIAPLLRNELVKVEDIPGARGDELRHQLLAALAALDDAAAVDRLFAAVPLLEPRDLYRWAPVLVRGMREAHLPSLREYLFQRRLDDERREEITRWLSERMDLPVQPILEALYAMDDADPVRFAALRGLVVGADAMGYHARLYDAMRQPLSDEDRELAYYLIGSAPSPLREADLRTVARLLLVAPLADPREAAEAAGWGFPRGSSYPMHIPLIDLLRREQEIDVLVFEAVADEALAHADRHALSGRRLAHLAYELAALPALRGPLTTILARMILRAPETDPRYAGIARLLLGEGAEADGAWDEAAEHYTEAARILLRHPLPPLVQRALLGESSALDGLLPEAGLAAKPALCRARALEADSAAAAEQLDLAAALGEGDRATMMEIARVMEAMGK